MTDLIQIAVDGPAGAGKSTIAKLLANRLNYTYIDTGAMFRVVAYTCLVNGIDVNNSEELKQILDSLEIEFVENKNYSIQQVFCNGIDVTEEIRTPQVSAFVSTVATIPLVREKMLELQQRIGANTNVIMDGRDIGTVVLPNAKYKFFLTASLEARTERRMKDLITKGFNIDYEELMKNIAERDRKDSERELAPLKPADTAVVIDTSGMSIEDVVEKLFKTVKK